MLSNPIIVLGPPRSGTSITTRIIQAHLGTDFPFDVNRHSEPEELIQIERDWFQRQGASFDNRFYFPTLRPDTQLLREITTFFSVYEQTPCVIKSPIFSILSQWIALPLIFPTVYVYRGVDEMAESLIYHKHMDKADAYQSAEWFYTVGFRLRELPLGDKTMVFFSNDKHAYQKSVSQALSWLGMEFSQHIFNQLWDGSQIEYYKQ